MDSNSMIFIQICDLDSKHIYQKTKYGNYLVMLKYNNQLFKTKISWKNQIIYFHDIFLIPFDTSSPILDIYIYDVNQNDLTTLLLYETKVKLCLDQKIELYSLDNILKIRFGNLFYDTNLYIQKIEKELKTSEDTEKMKWNLIKNKINRVFDEYDL